MIDLDSNNIYCEVTNKKNALYIINSTIRNPIRLLDFYYFVSLLIKKFGSEHAIAFQDFLDFVDDCGANLLTHKNHTLPARIEGFSKRFCELKLLGLIDFKVQNGCFYFTEKQLSADNFNPCGYTLDTSGFDFLETNSNFLLFILSKRNTLHFITSLIQTVDKRWKDNYQGKRQGLSNLELSFIYVLVPFLEQKGKNNVHNIADIILEYRSKYNNLPDSKPDYSAYLETQLEIYTSCHRQFKFIKLASAQDYIDVLLRTLESTHCFKCVNKFKMHSLIINDKFMSKLCYFLSVDFQTLENQFISNTFLANLKKYEKKYYLATNEHVSEPTSYRYNNQIADRKNNYLSSDIKIHNNALLEYGKKDNLYWYEFEDLNNLLLTHYVKFYLQQNLNADNLKYAIKLDSQGGVKNSTSSGVEDLSIQLKNCILVVESSLQSGLSARKNEGPPVIDHCNKIYFNDSEKRQVLCFIVFPHKPSAGFDSDFITHNRFNLEVNKDILYYPICIQEFKKIMIEHPVDVEPFIQEAKNKLGNMTEELKNKSREKLLTFNDFGLTN